MCACGVGVGVYRGRPGEHWCMVYSGSATTPSVVPRSGGSRIIVKGGFHYA